MSLAELERITTLETWREEGRALAADASGFAWRVGDWLNRGADRWGSDVYRDAEDIFDLSRSSLQTYSSVARRFSNRLENLSFSHHALVAAIPEEAAQQWLQLAADNKWSRREFAAHLKTVQQLPPGERPSIVATVYRIQVPAAEDESWQRAAQTRNMSVEQWVVTVANEAARTA